MVPAGPEVEVWVKEWVVCNNFLNWEPQDSVEDQAPGILRKAFLSSTLFPYSRGPCVPQN